MNRGLHRVIFNAARGERMVVSETAKTCAGSSCGDTSAPDSIESLLLSTGIALTGIAAAALLTFTPLAQAQIIADPSAPGNQRPIVLAAPNGVPVVNIQTPSAAGVSRNTYSRFDVQRDGLILNNSRTNVSTQLGGWISGNPYLATGPARVILNEVNSASPSQLRGWVEVGGQRAEVIVANPAGIQVDGAGFINASGVTLTTGTPVVNAGNLESFRVTGGRVNVEDNTLTGEIVGGNARLQIAGDAINRGLIDGGAVRVDAATLTNVGTGRIYGDHLMIEAQQVGNVAETAAGVSSTATMAARDRLDIGAQDLLNAGGSLVFSAGDLAIGGEVDAQGHAVGSASSVTNRASTIEALGSVGIAAAQLSNLNEGFSTRVETSNESVAEHYIRLGGTLYLPDELGNCFKCASNRYDQGIDHWRLEYVAPSSRYPFEAGYSRVPYRVYESWGVFKEDDLYEYAPTDAVWALFGVPVGNHRQLADQLLAYNTDLMNRAYRDFDQVWISSQQTVQTVVDNPGVAGRIVSGGHMRLAGGSVLNDNSQIIAGGTLDISGSTLTNVETPGERTVTDFGTLRRDTVSYDPYGPREGYYGWGSYVGVREHVATRLDTSQVLTQTSANGNTGAEVRTTVALPGVGVPGAPQGLPSLYRQASDPSSGYLIETDPRFADYRQWLGSDYLLAALSYDPVTLHKRLGDGFYEQRLIREQIGQLTGQRFLDGYASDEAQYRALMEAGVTYANAWNLVPGVALTAWQMAQLTSDIVWLVAEEVILLDSTRTTALVPRVYVRAKEGDLTAGVALLAGKDVNINLSGDLVNQGTVAGRRVVNLSADNVNNLGGHIQGEAVVITAAQDVNNIGGTVQAGSYLDVYAGRNLNVQSTTSTAAASAGRSSSSLTQVDRVAGLYVSEPAGVLIASAGQDVNVKDGEVIWQIQRDENGILNWESLHRQGPCNGRQSNAAGDSAQTADVA